MDHDHPLEPLEPCRSFWRDLCCSPLAAQWALNVITLAGFVAGIVTLYLLAENVKNGNVQSRYYNLAARPWIAIDRNIDLTSELYFLSADKPGAMRVRVRLRNDGTSPARFVRIKTRVVLEDGGAPEDKLKRFCQTVRSETQTSLGASEVLFTGERSEIEIPTLAEMAEGKSPLNIERQDISAYQAKCGRQRVSPLILGCVDYMSSMDNAHHQTGFAYRLVRFATQDPRAPQDIDPGDLRKGIPPSDNSHQELEEVFRYAD